MQEETVEPPTAAAHKIAAQEFRDRGISAVPMGPDKHPPIRWKPYQDRLPTDDEIDSWDWSLGVMAVTGVISGIVALDADSPEAIAYAEGQGIPEGTPRFRPGGGCSSSSGIRASASRRAPV